MILGPLVFSSQIKQSFTRNRLTQKCFSLSHLEVNLLSLIDSMSAFSFLLSLLPQKLAFCFLYNLSHHDTHSIELFHAFFSQSGRQTASSRFWTRVTDSNFYHDNRYTTGACIKASDFYVVQYHFKQSEIDLWPIDRSLTGTDTLSQSGPQSISIRWYSTHRTLKFEPHQPTQFSVITDTPTCVSIYWIIYIWIRWKARSWV